MKYNIEKQNGLYKLFIVINNERFIAHAFKKYPSKEEIALTILIFNRGREAQKVFISRNINSILKV